MPSPPAALYGIDKKFVTLAPEVISLVCLSLPAKSIILGKAKVFIRLEPLTGVYSRRNDIQYNNTQHRVLYTVMLYLCSASYMLSVASKPMILSVRVS
jgi:hypothetical protein